MAALLAQMEAAGLGFDPWHLQAAGAQAKAHMARLEGEAARVAGRAFNLASPQQLAEVLYETLKVGRVGRTGRSSWGLVGWGSGAATSCRADGTTPQRWRRPGAVTLCISAFAVPVRPRPRAQLPPPTAHGRSAAKTHLPTDEAALKSLRAQSPLPTLVLEFRALAVRGANVFVWGAEGASKSRGPRGDAAGRARGSRRAGVRQG